MNVLGLQQQNQGYSINNLNTQVISEGNRQRSYTDKPPIYLDKKNNPYHQNNHEEMPDSQMGRVGV